MDSYLPYDQQARDVESAVAYASPQDKQFLRGVKNRILRDKAAKQQLASRQTTTSPYATASSPNYGSGSHSSSGSNYTPSSSSSNPVDQARQRQDTRDFNSMIDGIEHGTATRTGNPYMR